MKALHFLLRTMSHNHHGLSHRSGGLTIHGAKISPQRYRNSLEAGSSHKLTRLDKSASYYKKLFTECIVTLD